MRSTLLLPLTLVAAAASAQNLVVNPGFELPDQNGGYSLLANDGQPGGWAASNGSLEIGDASLYGVTGQHQHQIAELDSNGNSTIFQNLATNVGSDYLVTFLYAKRADDPANSGFEVLWNGQVIRSFVPTSTQMKSHGFTITATNALTNLAFRSTGPSDSYGSVIDWVSVTPAHPVPEPSTMAVLALGALGLAKRRRKA